MLQHCRALLCCRLAFGNVEPARSGAHSPSRTSTHVLGHSAQPAEPCLCDQLAGAAALRCKAWGPVAPVAPGRWLLLHRGWAILWHIRCRS